MTQMTENIDRIKLPCYCTFEWRGKRRLGMIQNAGLRENGYEQVKKWFLCRLIELDKQTHQQVGDTINIDFLDDLIRRNKINIGKAKIVYYETIGRKPMKQKHPQAKVDSACGEGK